MIDEVLKKIGLSDKEITVYKAALRLGSQTATVIAANTEISRPTVYDIFKGLIKKGLVSRIQKGVTTYFHPNDPASIIDYLEKQKREEIRNYDQSIKAVEEVLPAIKSLENPQSTKPKVQLFTGERGIIKAYDDTLNSEETIRSFTNFEETYAMLPDYYRQYYKKRKELGIKLQAICPKNEESLKRHKKDKAELREMKFVDKKDYSFSPGIDIYNKKILFTSWREKMAVMIESDEISDLFKKIYDLLWRQLR